MTILKIEGFDLYNNIGPNNGMMSRWRPGAGGNFAGLIPGRFGNGQAFQFANSPGGAYWTLGFGPQPQVTIGCAVRWPSLPSGGLSPTYQRIVLKDRFDRDVLGYTISTFGEIGMYRADGAMLATSAPDFIRVNTWHYMEFEVTIHNTAGSIRVWVDGFPAIDVTNIDTRMYDDVDGQNVAHLGLRTDFQWQAVQIDDIYIKVGTRLGERRIETIVPNGDTVTKQWTPNAGTENFSRVNESLVDLTTYVSANTVGATDLYELQNMAATPVSIDFVQVSAYANKEDAATRGLALVAELGGQQIVSPTKSISTSVNRIEHGMPTKPGGGVWTKADVDALRAGVRIVV